MNAKPCLLPAPPGAWRRRSTLRWRQFCWPWSCCCSSGDLAAWFRSRPPSSSQPSCADSSSGPARSFRSLPTSPKSVGTSTCWPSSSACAAPRSPLPRHDWCISPKTCSRLPFHWMWWPAIGGVIIGVGGLIQPRALGVGYDVINALLTGQAGLEVIVGILIVKTLIWSLSLGSGTSGGVLAPVFMIGGALGALVGLGFPHVFPGFWAILGLAAVVGGVLGSPLTGIVFTLELTHAWPALFPLIIAAVTAYAVSVLLLDRSVLTEKIARRGLHVTRDYTTDPLETFFVADVMRPEHSDVPVGGTITTRDTLRHAANV